MEIFQFGEYQVDTVSRSLKRGQALLTLNRRAFDVLLYLVRNPGRVLTKEELLKNVWPDAFVDENSLAQSISVLRKALAGQPGEASYILTVSGRGYQFTCPVRSLTQEIQLVEPAQANGQEDPSEEISDQERTMATSVVDQQGAPGKLPLVYGSRSVRGIWGAILLFATIASAVLAWRNWHRSQPSPVVVIADLENATGESGLSQVLDSAVATDLKQSPYLNLLSPVHVQETLSQMQQKKDTPLTPILAREVCLRNNAQVMLRGVVAKFGRRYLITLDATECVSGDSLGSSKAEAANADEIPHAIDEVADEMRRKLGESRASIHQFGTPLFSANTGSFEALRNYSNAVHLASHGRYSDALPLLQRAVELDPKFAVAYADLAASYRNVGERAMEAQNLKKAYELRDSANERDRLLIIARYHDSVTGDLDEGLRNYQTWTNIYPWDTAAWVNMADLYIRLGQAELAIAPAKRSLELNSQNAISYVVLGRALMHAGQLNAAKSVCEQAIARALDGDDLHSLLMQVNFALHDANGVEAQIAWGRSHASAIRMRLNEALLAAAEGRLQQGLEILEAISTSYKRQGLAHLHTFYLQAGTRILAETGHPQEARKYLDSLAPVPGMTDPVVAMAETGEEGRAEEILKRELAQHPDDTMWTSLKGPQIRAAILLARHKPEEAVDALRPTMAYDLREFDTPFMRGTAYLNAHQPGPAEQEFHKVIDHLGIDPLSYVYPLAYLGLARSLAAEHKIKESHEAYEKFLALWKEADQNEPILKQARAESSFLKDGS
jgi:eukaryotic-like serine/threonine-protein kinase